MNSEMRLPVHILTFRKHDCHWPHDVPPDLLGTENPCGALVDHPLMLLRTPRVLFGARDTADTCDTVVE